MAIADLSAPCKDISISGPAGKSAAAREEMDNAVQEPAVRPNQVRMLRLGLHRWRQRQARLVADVLTDERHRPCDNRRTVPRTMMEAIVLKGIEEKLAAPEVIAEYVREYHRITRELHSSVAHRRRDLEKQLGNINGSINKAVDAILAETPSRALRDRLTVLEAEHDRIGADIANIVPPTIEFHPNAGDAYSSKIRDLKATLAEADDDSRLAVHQAIQEIVEKIVIHPHGRYKPVEIEIYGQLAALLRISERAAEPPKVWGCVGCGDRI